MAQVSGSVGGSCVVRGVQRINGNVSWTDTHKLFIRHKPLLS